MISPVLVAGAGVGGLSAALALAHCNQQVLVLERAPELSEVGAGLQIGPNAARRLRKWGALDGLAGKALAPEAVDFFDGASGRLVVSMSLKDIENIWGAPYLTAHRADLLGALEAAARAHENIAILTDSEVESWREDSDGVNVATTDGRQFQGRALIGADGVRSRIRAKLAPGDSPDYSGWMAFRALLPMEGLAARWRSPRANVHMGRGAHIVHYPLREQSVLNVVVVIEQRLSARLQADEWSYAAETDMLRACLQGWPDDIVALTTKGQWRAWGLFTRGPSVNWVRGRTVLLGDAAHAMVPFLAQGAAQAIEDADALGQAFRAHPNDPPLALKTYYEARKQRARKIQARSMQQAAIYHLDRPASVLRNLAMRALGSRGMIRTNGWIYAQ